MSYRVRFTYADGSHGWLEALHQTREDAEWHIRTQPNPNKCFTYTVDEFPDVSTAEVPNTKPSIGAMPRRIWEEQRIRALGEAIVRRMGHEEPMVASVFDLAHIRDWAAEIVELCDRHGGQHPTTPRRSPTL